MAASLSFINYRQLEALENVSLNTGSSPEEIKTAIETITQILTNQKEFIEQNNKRFARGCYNFSDRVDLNEGLTERFYAKTILEIDKMNYLLDSTAPELRDSYIALRQKMDCVLGRFMQYRISLENVNSLYNTHYAEGLRPFKIQTGSLQQLILSQLVQDNFPGSKDITKARVMAVYNTVLNKGSESYEQQKHDVAVGLGLEKPTAEPDHTEPTICTIQ